MEYQDKVELLRKYKEAHKLAKYYQDEVEQYRATKEQAKSQQITGMPFAHGGSNDLSDYIVKLDEISNKMYKHLREAEQTKLNILVWSESLNDVDERLIINYHYIKFMTYKQIAEILSYDESTVRRKSKSAVNNLPDLKNNIWIDVAL